MEQGLRGKLVVVDCCGSLFRAERSERGYYVCPICREAVFFSEKDLILHIGSHVRGYTRMLHKAPRRS